jgi:hypothetical protein
MPFLNPEITIGQAIQTAMLGKQWIAHMVIKWQDDVIIVLLHQMVVLCNRIEDSYNYCVCSTEDGPLGDNTDRRFTMSFQ